MRHEQTILGCSIAWLYNQSLKKKERLLCNNTANIKAILLYVFCLI